MKRRPHPCRVLCDRVGIFSPDTTSARDMTMLFRVTLANLEVRFFRKKGPRLLSRPSYDLRKSDFNCGERSSVFPRDDLRVRRRGLRAHRRHDGVLCLHHRLDARLHHRRPACRRDHPDPRRHGFQAGASRD